MRCVRVRPAKTSFRKRWSCHAQNTSSRAFLYCASRRASFPLADESLQRSGRASIGSNPSSSVLHPLLPRQEVLHQHLMGGSDTKTAECTLAEASAICFSSMTNNAREG